MGAVAAVVSMAAVAVRGRRVDAGQRQSGHGDRRPRDGVRAGEAAEL